MNIATTIDRKAVKAFELQERMRIRVSDIFARAAFHFHTKEEIGRNVKKEVWQAPEMKAATALVSSWLDGYIRARFDELVRHHLIGGVWKDENGNPVPGKHYDEYLRK